MSQFIAKTQLAGLWRIHPGTLLTMRRDGALIGHTLFGQSSYYEAEAIDVFHAARARNLPDGQALPAVLDMLEEDTEEERSLLTGAEVAIWLGVTRVRIPSYLLGSVAGGDRRPSG